MQRITYLGELECGGEELNHLFNRVLIIICMHILPYLVSFLNLMVVRYAKLSRLLHYQPGVISLHTPMESLDKFTEVMPHFLCGFRGKNEGEMEKLYIFITPRHMELSSLSKFDGTERMSYSVIMNLLI